MRARTLIGFFLVASFIACGGPEEVFNAKGGLTGTAGTLGGAGTTGTAGTGDPSGLAGTNGAAGTAIDPTGLAGTNGQAGTGGAGTTAAAGTTGQAGTTAAAGTSGAAGTRAAAGTTGSAGTTAAAGTTGTAGTSAAAGTSGAAGTGAAGTAASTGPTTRIDSNGTAAGGWSADVNVTGGNGGLTNNDPVNVTGVANAAPQTVYQTTRIGSFTYTIPGFTGPHTVRLHFCETYFPQGADTVASAIGKRKCNVSINGKQVLPNYDIIMKSGAKMKAVVEQFTEPPNAQGQYVIQFTTVSDNCALGGLEILP
jgi:hypothetical protein